MTITAATSPFTDLAPTNKQSSDRAVIEENRRRIALRVTATTEDLTVDDWQDPETTTSHAAVLDCDATSAQVNITLPDATTNPCRLIVFRKSDASGNNVVVTGASSQTINGSSSFSLTSQYEVKRIVSDGSNWIIV